VLISGARMAGAMLILLAAIRLPALRQLVAKEVRSTGRHLNELIPGWMAVSGEPVSPSVDQSLRIIAEVTDLIEQDLRGDARYQLVHSLVRN